MPITPKIIAVTKFRQNAGSIIKDVVSTQDPVFVTQHGKTSAVMVSVETYEQAQRRADVLYLLAKGEKEVEAGVGYELAVVLKEADDYLEGK